MENLVVRKSNALVESCYMLPTVEQKILAYIITKVHKDDKNFRECTIRTKDLFLAANVEESENHSWLKRHLMSLARPIHVEYKDEHGEIRHLLEHIISTAEWPEHGEVVKVKLGDIMSQFLLGLGKNKFYTSYPFRHIVRMNSKYSVRIYEIVEKWRNPRLEVTEFYLLLEDLRNMLRLKPDELRPYTNFKTRAVQVAILEINEKTDLNVSFEEERLGHRVYRLKFKVGKKDKSVEARNPEHLHLDEAELEIQEEKTRHRFIDDDTEVVLE